MMARREMTHATVVCPGCLSMLGRAFNLQMVWKEFDLQRMYFMVF